MNRLAVLLAALALAAFALAACGGGESSGTEAATTEATGGGGGATISISADPNGTLAYTEKSINAPAGDDTIAFDNPAPLEHDVVIEDADGNEIARTDTISQDVTSTTARLEAGTYVFYCSVDGHRDAGMEGTLTVK